MRFQSAGRRRDAHREPRQRQRGGVGQHMAGIGEQRQRPGDDAARRLGDERHGREHAGRSSRRSLRAAAVAVTVTVAGPGPCL